MSTVALDSKYDPTNGKNLMPKRRFNKLNLDQLPTKSSLDKICRIHTIIHTNGNATTALLQNLSTSGYSVGKIYNCASHDPKVTKDRLNQVWKEYQIIDQTGLNEYFSLYFDAQTDSLIIHQQAYNTTLNQYVEGNISTDAYKQELQCKRIAKDILFSLWRLHNSHYVHTDIKPDNIMERNLDHLYTSPTLRDGWLLIDFNEIKPNKSKGTYVGTMGWSAPEIAYNSSKNMYTYASDIFAFGLVILYILCGKQPLQIPNEQRKIYKANKGDDRVEILKKRILRKQVLSNWYYGSIQNSENTMKTYLRTLYSEHKISIHLYTLLSEGILCYNPKQRFDCKKIYKSEWFRDV